MSFPYPMIAAVSAHANLSKADAGRALKALTTTIAVLKAGDSVALVGFGSFVVKDRPARMGRNPQTGLEIKIPASKSPAFKPGKALKDAINT